MIEGVRWTRNAFTLVELLITLLIIVVLGGIALSTFSILRKRSADVECINNVRSITLAIVQYAADNSGRLPDSFANPYQHDSAWGYRIGTYLGQTGQQIHWAGRDYMRCPAAEKNSTTVTYGVNYTGDFISPPLFAMRGKSGRLSSIRSSTMLIGDAVENIIYSPKVWPLNNANGDSSTKHSQPYNCASFPHSGKMHAGLADGSVRALSLRDWKTNSGNFYGP